MKKRRNSALAIQSKPLSTLVAGTIRQFSQERRNTIRGTIAAARRGTLNVNELEAIRNNVAEGDMVAAAIILESPAGLRKRAIKGLLQRDIVIAHNLQTRTATLEAAYASGFLGAWKDEAIRAIQTIAVLAQLTEVSQDDALGALLHAAEKWGASNYLALKIAYVKEFFDLDDSGHEVVAKIDRLLGHEQSPMIQYLALENIMPRLSIFSVARRHTNILRDHINEDFRRYHSLNNLTATPFCHDDCAGFILRGVETSLIDTVRCLWIIVNLKKRLPEVYASSKEILTLKYSDICFNYKKAWRQYPYQPC